MFELYRPGLIAMLLLLAGCSDSDKLRHIQITGSSTLAPLLIEMATAYEQAHPDTRIDVQAGGSSRGIADARSGLADIGMVSRGPNAQEFDLQFHTIARDGIALIVHSNNSISNLSDEQVQSIYRGKLDNWKTLGGNDAKINVVSKAEGRSTLELFLHYFDLRSSEIRAHAIIGDNEQGIKTVAGNPNAVGYVSIGTAQYSLEQGVPIKLLAISGVLPSIASVRSGEFPLSRPLNLVTAVEPAGLVADFINYTQSAVTESFIEQQYFVPLTQ